MSPQFVVADLSKAIEFYTTKLGFEVEFTHEDFYAGIIKDGHSIHLKTKHSIGERINKRKNEDLDVVFSVEGIEELYAELANRSVEFTQPLRDMPYGKEFYLEDPDGYVISFMEAKS